MSMSRLWSAMPSVARPWRRYETRGRLVIRRPALAFKKQVANADINAIPLTRRPMTDDSNVPSYDSFEETDATKEDLYPVFDGLDGPGPLTIDGHRLIEGLNEDD